MCGRVRILQNTTERAVHQTMRVKPKLQRRLEEGGDGKNMEHLLKKGTSKVQRQPRREAICTTASKAIAWAIQLH